MQALKEKKIMASKCGDEAFTSRGFSNWKDAKVAFTKHEQTKCHKEATDQMYEMYGVVTKICNLCTYNTNSILKVFD